MSAKVSSRLRLCNLTVLFALAFNLIYFIHELALVVAGAWLGNDPILFHNNMHYLNMPQPTQNLAFAAGPVAVFVAGLLGLMLYFMARHSTGTFKFFAFWFAYHGVWLFLAQVPEIAFASHGDFARGIAVLNLCQPSRVAGAILGVAGLIFLGLFATRPLLAGALSSDELATAGSRRKLILQSGILPWLLGSILIIPFRLPPLERAILPLFGGVPLILAWLNAGRAQMSNAAVQSINKKISWAGITALVAVFLGFRFILAAGVPFYNLFYQPAEAAPSSRVYQFVNGNWFDGSSFVQKNFYSVAGVLRAEHAGPVDSTIDLQNRFVIPPFAETHNHHFSDAQDYRAQIHNYLTQGIFYAKNPNNTQKWTTPIQPHLNFPASVDAVFSNGGLTASGGHPIQLYELIAQQNNNIFGWSKTSPRNQAYFVVDSETDLIAQWPQIKAGKPDFIKIYLETSEEYELRKNDPKYFGQRGLDPQLVPKIVARAHQERLRVSAHVNTAGDFHHALAAGVDEITHLPLAKIRLEDAMLAAKQNVFVVTTTLSHRPSGHVAGLHKIHRDNLRLLDSCGVKLAIGTDDNNLTALNEAENIFRLQVFDNLKLLKIWTENTPQTIFPQRRIGYLQEGYEASFLALEDNPLTDFSSVNKISFRFKQGHIIQLAATQRSLSEALMPVVMLAGADSAVAQYHRLKREQPGAYNFAESELNRLGYLLLNHGKAKAAIVIFKLNAEAYPGSANVYDSLADAYKAAGETQLAKQCYEKVLELLPGSHQYNEAFRGQLEKRAKEGLK
jgi:tetratricopeptide (TPR) repeat protein